MVNESITKIVPKLRTAGLGSGSTTMQTLYTLARNSSSHSVWTGYANNDNTSFSDSAEKYTKTLNTLSLVGAGATVGVKLFEAISILCPKGVAGATQESATTKSLKSATEAAEKSHDYAPLQDAVTSAWTDYNTKQTEVTLASKAEASAKSAEETATASVETAKGKVDEAKTALSTAKEGLSVAKDKVSSAKEALANATPENKAVLQKAYDNAVAAQEKAQIGVDKAEKTKEAAEKKVKAAKDAEARAKVAHNDASKITKKAERELKEINSSIEKANCKLGKRGQDVKNTPVEIKAGGEDYKPGEGNFENLA